MTISSSSARPLPLIIAWLCLGTGLARAGDAAVAGDVLEVDQWFVGDLNGKPAMTMHAVVNRHVAGTRSDAMDSQVVINRSLGTAAVRFEVGDTQRFEEDAKGVIVSFVFDHVENDQAVSAVGRIVGDQVLATVHHLGRADEERLVVPPGVKLLGQQASQELLAHHHAWAVGDKEAFATLALVSNQVHIVQMTATFNHALANGDLAFDVLMDLMPVPTTMTITPTGELVAMTMTMGFITMRFQPSKGPVPLEGAEFASGGLVTAKGPAPSAGPVNRYRLPAGATVAEDDFQHVALEPHAGQAAAGAPASAPSVVTVMAQAKPSPLADPAVFLRAEPQLELDDPALRAWVKTIVDRQHGDQAELAENLRLAVRAYIIHKDLSQGDASALEAFRSQRGDCTEHANLLCAALRIAGIPARVECGLVFADSFGGWVGHAWNSAYVGGRWVHLDSAYPGVVRSRYLKLGTPSGGEWQATGAAMMGNLAKIMGKDVETLVP